MASLFCFLTFPHLCSIKEPGIQTPIRWLFWGISLPPSQSADFLNKVVFLASISYVLDLSGCCAVSRVTLNSVTAGGEVWNRLVLRRRQPCPHLDLQSFERNHACCLSTQSEVTQPQDTHTPSRAAHRGRAEWTGGQSGQVSRFDTLARPPLPSTINIDMFQTMLPCRLIFTAGI